MKIALVLVLLALSLEAVRSAGSRRLKGSSSDDYSGSMSSSKKKGMKDDKSGKKKKKGKSTSEPQPVIFDTDYGPFIVSLLQVCCAALLL